MAISPGVSGSMALPCPAGLHRSIAAMASRLPSCQDSAGGTSPGGLWRYKGPCNKWGSCGRWGSASGRGLVRPWHWGLPAQTPLSPPCPHKFGLHSAAVGLMGRVCPVPTPVGVVLSPRQADR